MPGNFIKKLALFLILLCVVNYLCVLVIKKFSAPYAANEIYATKYSYHLKNQSKFNTLFFGSSRTHRQINPGVIDSDLKEFGIKSFNMGSPGTFNPEGLFLYEDFLEKKQPESTVKYAFVELTEFTSIAEKNSFAPQSYYYLNFDYLLFILRYYSADHEMNFKTKAETVFRFVQGYFLNHFLPFYPRQTKEKRYHLGKKKDGFFPVDTSLKKSLAKDLLKAHADFLLDTSVLIRSVTNRKETSNTVYLAFLNQLISKSESCHIKLYFVIPPRLKNYEMLTYLKNHINDSRVIDLGDAEKYPELCLAQYSFDGGHLNRTGAILYSTYLAHEIRNKISLND